MNNENKPTGTENNKDAGANKGGQYHKNRKKKHHNNNQNKQNEPQKNVGEFHNSKNHHKKNRHKGQKKPQEQNPAALDNEAVIVDPEIVEATETYTEIADESIYETDIFEKKPEITEEVAKVEIIGIRFKAGGKTYFFSPNGITAKRGSHAIVETARGQEFGEVAVANSFVPETEIVPPLRPVIRIATEADVKHHEENKKKEDEAFKICNEKIAAHELDMKLIDAQYTFDNTKLLFYFTSAGRVDFRELVKDLASVFKTRIELRQIGIRDEAKLIGGLGICGRPLCCSVFLSDFGQVSIKMAKEQNLSLNSAKISGSCGRLMCCLRYEHETYVEEIKNTPAVDSKVKTADGIGTVTEISPLAGKIKVRLDDKPDQAPKQYHRDDVIVLPKQK